MKITRRVLLGIAGAAAFGQSARTADKIVSGTLGGQAPLWPFYIASQKGFFAAQDLDVEINFAQSGAAVTQQLTGGAYDVVLSVGISDPIHAVDKGASLALIRIIGDAAPYALIGKPGLKTIADLKGKTVSVGQVNDPTTYYFERMAAANGLKSGDYEELRAGVAASRFAALKAGVADAALVLPPLNFQANAAGYITLGFAADYIKDLPFTGMTVRRDWAQARASPGSTTKRTAAKPSSCW
jgi:NitT/TauT family transport system substrate-binding protein